MSLGVPLLVLLKRKNPSDPRQIELPLALEETRDFSLQQLPSAHPRLSACRGNLDMRNWLMPRRLTLLMWDQVSLMRHTPGEAYADYDRVFDKALER